MYTHLRMRSYGRDSVCMCACVLYFVFIYLFFLLFILVPFHHQHYQTSTIEDSHHWDFQRPVCIPPLVFFTDLVKVILEVYAILRNTSQCAFSGLARQNHSHTSVFLSGPPNNFPQSQYLNYSWLSSFTNFRRPFQQPICIDSRISCHNVKTLG